MARRASPCTQADITRLIKAAIAAGLGEKMTGIKITRDGAFLFLGDKSLQSEPVDELTKTDDSWSDIDAA